MSRGNYYLTTLEIKYKYVETFIVRLTKSERSRSMGGDQILSKPGVLRFVVCFADHLMSYN